MGRDTLGSFLQLFGLTLLPCAVLAELQGQIRLGQSLGLAGLGALAFLIGHRLRERS